MFRMTLGSLITATPRPWLPTGTCIQGSCWERPRAKAEGEAGIGNDCMLSESWDPRLRFGNALES